jgi:hypothetical protein
MRKRATTEKVYSKPTMCLGCHLVAEMSYEHDADPVKGAWECPRCGRKYPFAYWTIRRQAPAKFKAAA